MLLTAYLLRSIGVVSRHLSRTPTPASSSSSSPPPDQDLTIFVQQLLEQMQGRFSTMSDQIIGRIDEMGGRIDDLEKSIGDLMETAGVDAPEAGPPPDGPPPS